MNIRTRATVAVAAISLTAVAALTGCATTSDTGSSTAGPAAAPSATATTPAAGSALTTSATSLGTVVVDGTGMTVYVFDKDTQGAMSSARTGGCATTWPAVETDSTTPQVTGITGKVGTITGTDGKLQLTLDGWPLYRFASDTAAGDVKGQGVGGIWWVVGADGAKISAKVKAGY